MRIVKKKNMIEVAKAIIKNPLLSERDIANSIWVSHTTVQNAKKELCQQLPKEASMVDFLKIDLDIQTLSSNEIRRRLTEEISTVRITELKELNESSFKRRQLLGGWATDRMEVVEIFI